MSIHEQDRRQLAEEKTDHVKDLCRDFPGGPVAKSLCSQRRGPRFNPWSRNKSFRATVKIPSAPARTWHSQVNIKNKSIKDCGK